MRNHRPEHLLLISALALTGACVDDVAVGTGEHEIVNGVQDFGHPSVVRVFAPGVTNPQPDTPACTGVLVYHNTVLTAAHCVVNGAAQLIQFDGGSGFVGTATRHPGYTVPGGINDVAVIRTLDKMGRPFYARVAAAAPQIGDPITLSGYGVTAAGAPQDGVKRMGTTTITGIDPNFFYFHPTLTGPAGTDTGTCSGDSGGPAFFADTNCVLGITKGGPATCQTTGPDWLDSRLDLHLGWLQSVTFNQIPLC